MNKYCKDGGKHHLQSSDGTCIYCNKILDPSRYIEEHVCQECFYAACKQCDYPDSDCEHYQEALNIFLSHSDGYAE